MEQKTTSPAKAAVPHAVTFGIIMILEYVLMYVWQPDIEKMAWIGIVMNLANYLILPIVFISLACTAFKKANGGYISFGQSLKAGVSVMALAALIYGLFIILFNFIFPEYQEQVYEKTKEIAVKQNPNMTAEQLKMSLKFTRIFVNPLVQAPFTILMYSFFGLLYSLIIGAIVKKEKPGAY